MEQGREADPPPEWMRTSDVARRLGYSTTWVRQQISSGRLHAQMHSTGKRPSLRIRRADFERFVLETFRSTDGEPPGFGSTRLR